MEFQARSRQVSYASTSSPTLDFDIVQYFNQILGLDEVGVHL